MKIVFVDSNNRASIISEVKDEKEGIRAIGEFLEKYYTSCYWRLYEIEYQDELSLCVDILSHPELFYIVGGRINRVIEEN